MLTHMYSQSLDSSIVMNMTDRSTRSSGKILFKLPMPRSKFLNSFVYSGASAWNNLTLEEQMVPDLDQFKRNQKKKTLELEKSLYDTENWIGVNLSVSFDS